ncbi:histamine H2 receptor-like [Stylophora pistillata]|uniref:histamine H2 receptor-like n=1 Tax=Stylophora pistillata TaxID=50429 RepID=UPI000C03CCC3|nr:histamine H2 receptor-like [Stylophora pistillata]
METWFWIFGWSLSLLTITGNGFIIFLVCRRRRLQTKTNAFVVSLAVADVCVGLSTVPPLFVCEKTTGCDPEVPFANRVDYLRWLFMYASVTNLCSLVLDRYFAVVQPLKYLLFMTRKRVSQIIFLSWALSILLVSPDVLIWLALNDNRSLFLIFSWIIMTFVEFLPSCGLIFCFGSMVQVVYKHERAARILAKQLHFNHRYLFKNAEKSAVKVMGIVIGLFLVCSACSLRCSLIYIMKEERPCKDKKFKLPLLILNSAINPVAYALFKRDIKEEAKRRTCCVIWKKRNNIEPLNDLQFFSK